MTNYNFIVVIEMPTYRIGIRRKDYEFSFEEENLENLKGGLQDFLSLVEGFEKPTTTVANKSSKRGGGRRPPFVKNAILELTQKEPAWLIDKFPVDVRNKINTEYGAVGAKTESVNVVLIRLFNARMLTRKELDGKYAYSMLSVPH